MSDGIILLVIILLFVLLYFISYTKNNKYNPPNGGCLGTRFGCCPNGTVARQNVAGTNCSNHPNIYGGCAGTRFGCCPNGIVARQNLIGSNC